MTGYVIILYVVFRVHAQYSSIAQSVERAAVNRVVVGSSPTRGVFSVRILIAKNLGAEPIIIIWLLGQAVKTSPFHGGNTGSIPVGVIYKAQ